MKNSKQKLYDLLRWSEKYTKTDMVYLSKGGFWLGLNQAISTIAGFILLVAFANLIAPETYGTYRYILSILGILAIGTFPGINTVAIKTVAEKNEEVFWKLFYKKSFLSLLTTILCFFTSLYYFLNDNTVLYISFLIAGVGLPIVYLSGMYESLLYGRKNFKRSAQLNILNKIIITLSIIITIYITDNIIILMLVYFVPEIITQSLFLFYFYNKKINKKNDTNSSEKSLTNFGIHLSVMEVLKTIASQIDKLLVFHYLGAAQLAIYAIASTLPSQIKTTMQNLNILALPKMSVSKNTDLRETLPKKLFKLEIIIVVIIIIYWFLSPFIFSTFFPKYIESILISKVYALSLLFFPRTFLSTAMTAQLKQKELYKIRIMAPIIRIAIFLIALPIWGIWGAVIGSIISGAITSIIYSYYFAKAFPKIKNLHV